MLRTNVVCRALTLSTKVEKFANLVNVGRCHQSGLVEVSFAFLGLLRQDVAVVSVFPFDFACACEGETLLRGRVSLNFWHFC